MLKSNKILATLLAASLFTVAAPAMADNDEMYYQQNRSQFITYEQAAQAAQKTIGGGVVKDVEFEKKWNGEYFDVEVVDNQGREYDVRIDAKTGKVIYSKRDY